MATAGKKEPEKDGTVNKQAEKKEEAKAEKSAEVKHKPGCTYAVYPHVCNCGAAVDK